MTFKKLVSYFLIIWLVYWIFLFVQVVNVVNNLELRFVKNPVVTASGSLGLIKTVYIKGESTNSQDNVNTHKISRVYTGLTLSKFLLSNQNINHANLITFYALPPDFDGNIIHFAATSGKEKASALRLLIDACNYEVHKFILLHIFLFIVFISLKDIYLKIKKKEDVTNEMALVYNN